MTPDHSLSDDELKSWLAEALAASHRLPGRADMFMAGVSADWLIDLMALANLAVVRRKRDDQAD